ncbi:hypothetical protein L9F63_022755, partial [Diploptera punctata]
TYYLFFGVAFFHGLECLNCVRLASRTLYTRERARVVQVSYATGMSICARNCWLLGIMQTLPSGVNTNCGRYFYISMNVHKYG